MYSAEQLGFIRKKYATMPLSEVTRLFNKRFGLNMTHKAVLSACKNHGITCGRKGKERINPYRGFFTKGKIDFLISKYKEYSLTELTDIFNAEFHSDKTKGQIRSAIHSRGIVCGRTGHFGKGHVTWNKGVKGFMGPNVTSFKKGNTPAHRRPLGSERIDSKDGFILVKIAEPNPHVPGSKTRFKHKHVHVWEQLHGPVPKNHVVAFKDSNKLNCDPGNLMLLRRSELLSLNQHGYKDAPDEIKPSVLLLAKLEAKAGFRLRPGRVGRRKNIKECAANG